jgi:hypothetical protein
MKKLGRRRGRRPEAPAQEKSEAPAQDNSIAPPPLAGKSSKCPFRGAPGRASIKRAFLAYR